MQVFTQAHGLEMTCQRCKMMCFFLSFWISNISVLGFIKYYLVFLEYSIIFKSITLYFAFLFLPPSL